MLEKYCLLLTVPLSFKRFTCGFYMQGVYFLLKASLCVLRESLNSPAPLWVCTYITQLSGKAGTYMSSKTLLFIFVCVHERSRRWEKAAKKTDIKKERGTGKEQRGLLPRFFFKLNLKVKIDWEIFLSKQENESKKRKKSQLIIAQHTGFALIP